MPSSIPTPEQERGIVLGLLNAAYHALEEAQPRVIFAMPTNHPACALAVEVKRELLRLRLLIQAAMETP
jgi:hypothetical protein